LENALALLYLLGNQNDDKHGDFDF
jgi:hypothetical protein